MGHVLLIVDVTYYQKASSSVEGIHQLRDIRFPVVASSGPFAREEGYSVSVARSGRSKLVNLRCSLRSRGETISPLLTPGGLMGEQGCPDVVTKYLIFSWLASLAVNGPDKPSETETSKPKKNHHADRYPCQGCSDLQEMLEEPPQPSSGEQVYWPQVTRWWMASSVGLAFGGLTRGLH
jgi:hypothetical protein